MSETVELREWQSLRPRDAGVAGGLAGFRFSSDADRELAAQLSRNGTLGLAEMHDGLHVQARAHVGRVRFGGLTITVQPKVGRSELLALFRYALGLDHAQLLAPVEYSATGEFFTDLLVEQLHREASRLLSRGATQAYVGTTESLASPRGHIEFVRIASAGGIRDASLPCSHHPRSSDHLLNQVLVAGLGLAASLASRRELQRAVARTRDLAALLATPCVLSHSLLTRAQRSLTRLVNHYAPVVELVTMLYSGTLLELEDEGASRTLPGFLLDMNRFWQRLLERFLSEHLDGYAVEPEHGLRTMMRYVPGQNPQGRRGPTPRPDYAIRRSGQVVALLDAKYRDLWAHALPRDMLYQLSMYALSQPRPFTAAILFPTTERAAKTSLIEIADPTTGRPSGFVELRPVVLGRLAELVATSGQAARVGRAALARELALGVSFR